MVRVKIRVGVRIRDSVRVALCALVIVRCMFACKQCDVLVTCDVGGDDI